MAHPKHHYVRQRYYFRCGYCGVSETDIESELTVDHYQPLSAGGDDDHDNLVYACPRCNLFKGEYWAAGEDATRGWRVLHPIRDWREMPLHLRENEKTGELEALSETGRFHIALLQLNRPALVQHRLVKRLTDLVTARCRLLVNESHELKSNERTQREYIAKLRQLLGLPTEETE